MTRIMADHGFRTASTTDLPDTLIIDPDPQNLRAIRAYEKAGFRGETILGNEDGQPARMMTRYR